MHFIAVRKTLFSSPLSNYSIKLLRQDNLQHGIRQMDSVNYSESPLHKTMLLHCTIWLNRPKQRYQCINDNIEDLKDAI